ncbi:hypothetical protein [Putridiphycobacter roseus]|nr:hypothetical protein [Putridiphycobacter roseus]
MHTKTIEITRVEQYANKARVIRIYINGVKVGFLRDGETKSFEVPATNHEIYAKIDWCKTRPLKIDAAKNETVQLELGSNLTRKNMYKALYYTFFKPADFLYLKKR